MTAVAWHPEKRDVLALGCADGAVAVLDTVKGGPVHNSLCCNLTDSTGPPSSRQCMCWRCFHATSTSGTRSKCNSRIQGSHVAALLAEIETCQLMSRG